MLDKKSQSKKIIILKVKKKIKKKKKKGKKKKSQITSVFILKLLYIPYIFNTSQILSTKDNNNKKELFDR